jgi:hypothetical protein
MKTSTWITAAALIAVGFGAYALTADAQEGKQDGKKDKPVDAGAGMDDMTWFMPGPEHKILAERVGKWTFKMKMTGPDGQPMEESGTSEMKMSLNGLFLEDTTHADMMGMPFEGHGFTGFDKIKNKYTGVWLDSMSSGVMVMEGSYDAASKSFTFMMDMPDGMTHQYVKEKVVEKMVDKDHFTSTFTKVGGAAGDPGNFTIEYTRAK